MDTLTINMNHPLFMIRRAKDGDVWMYTFQMAPFRFSRQGAVLSARDYVDNATIVMPLIVNSEDTERVQSCIDTTVPYALYTLALSLMGEESKESINQITLFNPDTHEFQPIAFDLFMKAFWSAFPMFRVTATVTDGEIDGRKVQPVVLSWEPLEPWYKDNGDPVDAIPVPDSTTIDPVNLKSTFDNMLKVMDIFDAQCLIKDMLINEIIHKMYNCKLGKQRVNPTTRVTSVIKTTNLNKLFKEKLDQLGAKHGVK
jgi:hypothetical protein